MYAESCYILLVAVDLGDQVEIGTQRVSRSVVTVDESRRWHRGAQRCFQVDKNKTVTTL